MKFTVVMPCYNSEHYLAEAIESVIQQSYTDWELIIVDDGSTDTSFEIASTYKLQDQRIRLIQQPNSGKPAIARNVGIRLAKGNILCFLDADDRYETNRLEILASCFKQDPKADYLFHNYCLIDQQGMQIQQNVLQRKVETLNSSSGNAGNYIFAGSLYRYFLFHGCLVHTSTIAIRLERFDKTKLLFREDLTCAEDLMFWFYLAASANGGFISDSLSAYRDTPFSISKNQAFLDQETARFYEILLKALPIKLDSEAKEQIKRLISDNLLSSAYHFSKNGQKAYALTLASKAFTTRPSIRSLLEASKVIFRKSEEGKSTR